ncbi:F-box/LRR-repeat protein At3g03360-like isoform X2 [Apium graveolens]|uniref:F-box/LRR-repeat protein At3g03360-like isoform X2 n=1 Tax=Apium graveolens TaxID=4045 RepID=UPI003D7BD3C2
MGKKKIRSGAECSEDAISRLPDELIHKILSFVDAKVAVQSSILSKRWRFIWPTLPFLNFGEYEEWSPYRTYMFINHVLSNRCHPASVSELKMCVSSHDCVLQNQRDGCLVEKFVEYAITHNVECLSLELLYWHRPFKLSTFTSKSLKILTLRLDLEGDLYSCPWDLPVLTTLHLLDNKYEYYKDEDDDHISLDSLLTCLPALTTLNLEKWDLSHSFSFSLPKLTSLRLFDCKFPERVWNFPALLTLDLIECLPSNVGHVLSSLDNLQNLTAVVGESAQQDLLLSFPQLVNLSLRTRNVFQFPRFNIVVLAPKLRSFTSVGVFSITFEAPELENVYMKLQGRFQNLSFEDRETSNLRFAHMLLGLGNAKNISFDLDSMEDNMIPHTAAVSVTAANELVGESLATATKELVDCQYTNKNVCFDTTDVVVQKHYAVGNSLVDANSVRQYESLVEGTSNDPGSSSRKNKDFGMWRGHEVNSEFVCLLDNIMLKYPETFEHFGAKNKKLCTMNLNMLCTSLNDFSKVSMTEVDSEIIIAYKDVCAYLQNQGFNVSWVVNRLNYIEQLRFSKPLIPELHAIDCCINDTNSKIQDLQARVDEAKSLRMQKMTEIEKAFGTLGTKLAVGFLGDDLL